MMFRKSNDSIRLFVLDNGRMYLNQQDLIGPSCTDSASENPVEIPIYAVLIKHPDGFVLFDAGCHPKAMEPGGRWSHQLQMTCPWQVRPSDLLLNRLANLGVHPDDIRYIVCSHLHCDHAGNLEFFPNSEIFVHMDEWNAAIAEHGALMGDGEFVYNDVSAWLQKELHFHFVQPQTMSLELLPNITIHNIGRGHSYGMLALEVQLDDVNTVILASDAAFASSYYGVGSTAPFLSLDSEGYMRGTRRIAQLAKERCAQVWFGHDMVQFRSLKEVAGFE